LTQVLINLVGNAIKFTDTGEVAIKAEGYNGSFHVSVRDTGPGISAADQAKLFQEFQQADNAITRKKGGTGLGLAKFLGSDSSGQAAALPLWRLNMGLFWPNCTNRDSTRGEMLSSITSVATILTDHLPLPPN
jgi:hypothetical protein